ncbi:MAG: ATP-binding cassette domain-containing protein [Lactobacillales bacterium]|jgi:NitT/TauT family transport system ATP-binding protein|nr:ATP-binding cassette domain-containing protein [Lactobacillales bacterium]
MSTLNKNGLELRKITVKSGEKRILSDFSATFPAGKITTILGSSGVGKTTLLNVVAGLKPIQSGEMSFQGAPFYPEKRLIGLVPQDYGLLPWETSLKAVTNALKISKQAVNEAKIEALFAALSLKGLEKSYPNALSGGQKQRVALARAFAINADILLMDEPFSALDAITREKTQQLFLTTWYKNPTTTLFITHDIEEAILLGQQILVLGEDGSSSIFEQPEREENLSEKLRQVILHG